ncbi:50S ribosomal protein L34e [Candidatus Woesearchaeota archaeon]|nr:50S ribosomal protein L34e [Candidatus Woesearchaeota archaeon]
MVPARAKSRTMRRVFRRTPRGTKKVFELRNPKKAHCSVCSRELQGIPRMRPSELGNSPKTAKRPERPYGGVLCSGCSRRRILVNARGTHD